MSDVIATGSTDWDTLSSKPFNFGMVASISLTSDVMAMGSTAWDKLTSKPRNFGMVASV